MVLLEMILGIMLLGMLLLIEILSGSTGVGTTYGESFAGAAGCYAYSNDGGNKAGSYGDAGDEPPWESLG